MSYLQQFTPSRTPQTEPVSKLQTPNSAGGYSFAVDCFKRLERFLILGAEGGSYYAGERKLVAENCKALEECAKLDPARTVQLIVDISESGRAAKNDEALFALAKLASHDSERVRSLALAAVTNVCRTGTHLFQFVEFANSMRGWGRGLRHAVARWYTSKSQSDLAFQVAKYAQRNGWSHADVLSLCHGTDVSLNPVLRYVVAGPDGGGERSIHNKRTGQFREYEAVGEVPPILHYLGELKQANEGRTIQLIEQYGFTHEMIGTEHKNSAEVWEALLERMPPTAVIRNLGKMTQVGLLAPLSSAVAKVARRLTDPEQLRKARVHPIHVLSAAMIYHQGHGDKGSLNWTPVPKILEVLDSAFYQSFGFIEPSGKRMLLALDCSASMTWLGSMIPGLKIRAREASAVMAMVTARVEPNWHVMGFSGDLLDIPITPTMGLDKVIQAVERVPAGRTDCSLPFEWAIKNKVDVDMFAVYTDNETYAGSRHPHKALQAYRQSRGIAARSAVIGMVSNAFSIADPTDAGMIDLVGFDAAAPAFLSGFAKGDY